MRIIDRYILVQYVKTFLICWISLTGLYIVVDAFSNLDEFLRYSEQSGRKLLNILAEYYSYRSIFFFDRISAVLAMVSAMFTVTWIQRHNELTALMAAGISRIRVVRPILFAAAAVTIIAVLSREMLIPGVRAHLTRDPKDLLGDAAQEMPTFVDKETDIMLRGQFTQANERKIHRPNFVLPSELAYWGKHLSAVDAFYRPAEGDRPAGYLMKEVTSPIELLEQPSLKRGDKAVILTPVDYPDWLQPDECFVVSNIDFNQLSSGQKWRQLMSTGELVAGLHNPGLDYGAEVRVLVHSRLVQPLMDVTLLFLGLPLVLRRETRNVYTAIGMCAAMTAAFMFVGLASQYLGGILLLRPSLAAWLPLMLFVPAAVALYDRIDR